MPNNDKPQMLQVILDDVILICIICGSFALCFYALSIYAERSAVTAATCPMPADGAATAPPSPGHWPDKTCRFAPTSRP